MYPVTDRRRFARRVPESTESLRRVRSRTGRDLDVVDISQSGMLIEGSARLLPNTNLDVHIVTRGGRVLVRCRVVRAWVWHLEADLVRYRVALAFDRTLDTAPGNSVPGHLSGIFGSPGTTYPDGADRPFDPGVEASLSTENP
jgi:hypothetical protein